MMPRRANLIVTLTALLLFGFIATSLIGYHSARQSLTREIRESTLPLTSDNIYSEIQRDLLRPIFISSLMAQDTFVRDWAIAGESDPGAMIRYLKEIKARYGAVTAFFVSEKTRRYYHVSGVMKTVDEDDPQDGWYFRIREIDNEYEVNIDTDTADRKAIVIFINYRVYDYTGRFIGATGVGLAVNAVSDLIATYQNRYGRRVFFVDDSGTVVLHGPDYHGPENIHRAAGLSALAPQILSTPANALSYAVDGQTIHLNCRWVAEFKWYLLVEQMDNPAAGNIRATLALNLCISLAVTVAVLLLSTLAIGKYQRRIEMLAITDPLTGLANRHALDMLFAQAGRYARRQNGHLSVILFDIDHFKQVNDTHGHLVGDSILKAAALMAKACVRDSDTLCRWGGEEFLVLLPACDLTHAMDVAEKMRQTIGESSGTAGDAESVSITASFGVAEHQGAETLTELIQRVDRALYSAKAKGRNRVEAV